MSPRFPPGPQRPRRHRALVLCAAALVVLLSGGARARATAQDDEPNDSGIPCDRIVKMGYDRFSDLYTKSDPSESRTRQAAWIFASCKRKDNAARIARFAPAVRTRVQALDKTLSAWEQEGVELARAQSSGGTMWITVSAGKAATHTEFVGTLLPLLRKPAHPAPAQRAKVGRMLRKARKAQATLAKAAGGIEDATYRKVYDQAFTEWKSALTNLEGLLRTLPDDAAGTIAAHMEREIQAVLQDVDLQ